MAAMKKKNEVLLTSRVTQSQPLYPTPKNRIRRENDDSPAEQAPKEARHGESQQAPKEARHGEPKQAPKAALLGESEQAPKEARRGESQQAPKEARRGESQQAPKEAWRGEPRRCRSFKLLVDPTIHQSKKMVRFDGITVPGNPHHISPTCSDPRTRPHGFGVRLKAMDLPVPRFTIDENYVGYPLPVEVTVVDHLNDIKCGEFKDGDLYDHHSSREADNIYYNNVNNNWKCSADQGGEYWGQQAHNYAANTNYSHVQAKEPADKESGSERERHVDLDARLKMLMKDKGRKKVSKLGLDKHKPGPSREDSHREKLQAKALKMACEINESVKKEKLQMQNKQKKMRSDSKSPKQPQTPNKQKTIRLDSKPGGRSKSSFSGRRASELGTMRTHYRADRCYDVSRNHMEVNSQETPNDDFVPSQNFYYPKF